MPGIFDAVGVTREPAGGSGHANLAAATGTGRSQLSVVGIQIVTVVPDPSHSRIRLFRCCGRVPANCGLAPRGAAHIKPLSIIRDYHLNLVVNLLDRDANVRGVGMAGARCSPLRSSSGRAPRNALSPAGCIFSTSISIETLSSGM
ncbi:MAG: hypothetical protein H6672_20890 [Anaerolineaceae bacterium]|nr:hypothetical protein [Anaerolineaceae bacterium]